MDKNSKIYVAGSTGMVGSAIIRSLKANNYINVITHTHDEIDLTDIQAVDKFFEQNQPEYVIDAAAKVGGIKANSEQMADFLMENMLIQNNLINSSLKYNVQKFLFLASACIYPKFSQQPIKEESLLTGALEPTNEGYALAKIVGLKACEYIHRQYGKNYITAMPANAYGINDCFDPNNSHVIPALIKRFDEAKDNNIPEVIMWGTGKALREFLYVDDLADACIFLLEHYDDEKFINIGSGEEVSMGELASIIKDVVGYTGQISYDTTKPDGMLRRIVDSRKISEMGWKAKITLREGIEKEYMWYLENIKNT